MKTLKVTYNDHGPFTAITLERVGLGIHMYNSTEGFVHLCVSEKLGHTDDHWLRTIKPGDRLKFSYSMASDIAESTIKSIDGNEIHNKESAAYAISWIENRDSALSILINLLATSDIHESVRGQAAEGIGIIKPSRNNKLRQLNGLMVEMGRTVYQ